MQPSLWRTQLLKSLFFPSIITFLLYMRSFSLAFNHFIFPIKLKKKPHSTLTPFLLDPTPLLYSFYMACVLPFPASAIDHTQTMVFSDPILLNPLVKGQEQSKVFAHLWQSNMELLSAITTMCYVMTEVMGFNGKTLRTNPDTEHHKPQVRTLG